MIPFNKPYLTGNETRYIQDAVSSGHISGNGKYTKLCHRFFESRWGFKKALLTTSATDALEMCALLLDIQPGDEVIVPSYTFVSTALAFVRQGAKIVFCDSRSDYPGMDEDQIESLINPRTKAIVPVHYAGIACDMDKIMAIARRHDLYVVEDAAQAIDSYYTGRDGQKKPLGGIGHLGVFSFHETKNIQCGEGGLLVINDERFIRRAEIIWEKGTNRAEFFRGEVDKYTWIDVGSSFLPSDLLAAFLWAQLEKLETIQKQRHELWEQYDHALKEWADQRGYQTPFIPNYATNNAHMYYFVCSSFENQRNMMLYLNEKGVMAISHYLGLHKSHYYRDKHDGRELYQADHYSDCLVRLPFFIGLNHQFVTEVLRVIVKCCG